MSNNCNTGNKVLQRFTLIRNVDQVREYLQDRDAQTGQQLIEYFAAELDKGQEAALESHELQKLLITVCECIKDKPNALDKVEEAKRQMWSMNHSKIWSYLSSCLSEGIIPTWIAVAKNTGLSRQTVYNHIGGQSDLLPDMLDMEVAKYRQLIPSAIASLYRIGVQDSNVSALKAFINFMHRPEDTQTDTGPPPIVGVQIIDSNIQINNLSLTQEQISDLPDETRTQIEQILTQALQ